MQDFIKQYNPENRHKRVENYSEKTPDGRWRKYNYQDIIN
ncbi:hypothetical protein MNB_SUP05-SYMBIONT-4-354 [hydrothermal vent metagenome]|uniref:Uncharacterized protein n=1 Tax=hydrothermal vent metagenome TaxID=652676 RepID=A0A1W1DYY7_9ZZZZ